MTTDGGGGYRSQTWCWPPRVWRRTKATGADTAVVPIRGPVLQDRVRPGMARPEGFEPPTLWSEATCSGPLSYGRAARILAGRPRFTGPLSRPHARPAAVPRSSLNRKPSLWSPPGAAATVAGLDHRTRCPVRKPPGGCLVHGKRPARAARRLRAARVDTSPVPRGGHAPGSAPAPRPTRRFLTPIPSRSI